MANIKSKQFASLLTLSTASIDVVSGSFLPDAASTYNVQLYLGWVVHFNIWISTLVDKYIQQIYS